MFLRLKPKCKVWWKTIRIPFDCFVETLCWNSVNPRQIVVQNDALAANDADEVFDGLSGNHGGIEFHLVARRFSIFCDLDLPADGFNQSIPVKNFVIFLFPNFLGRNVVVNPRKELLEIGVHSREFVD
jgi:hypothetical protein